MILCKSGVVVGFCCNKIMLSSFIKQATGQSLPPEKVVQFPPSQQPQPKYDAVSASRSILSSYLSIASETTVSKKHPASEQARGDDRAVGNNSFSRGGGAGWRNFVGAFDDDEFVNTAPVAGAANVRKSTHVVERAAADCDVSSPGSVQSFHMPEPLYSPLTPSSNQPLLLHMNELEEASVSKPLSSSISMFHGSLKASDAALSSSKRVAFEPLRYVPPPQDSAIIKATEELQERVQQLTKQCEDSESAKRELVKSHAEEMNVMRAETECLFSENTRLRLELSELQVKIHFHPI
jgi:hypothetical protein